MWTFPVKSYTGKGYQWRSMDVKFVLRLIIVAYVV